MSEIPHANITRLKVKNYRSLAEIDITLMPLTVFVGKNAVGKSNVIDVLRFVRDGLRDGLECAVKMRGGMEALRCWFVPQSEDISIELHFSGPEYSGFYAFSFGNDSGKVGIKSEKIHLYPTQDTPKALSFMVVDGQIVKSSGIDALNDSLSQNTFLLSQLSAPIAVTVRDFLTNMNFYDLSPERLRKPQKALNAFPFLETGENLASALLELQRRREDYLITAPLEVIVEGVDGYFVEPVGDQLVTRLHYTFQNGQSYEFKSELSHEANGTIRLLGILTALYQERQLSPLAIEEPAKEIHSRELGVCSDVLKEATLRYQVIITTHSSDFINDFPVSSFLIVEKENGLTKIGPLISEQRDAIATNLYLLGELMQMEGLRREAPCQPAHSRWSLRFASKSGLRRRLRRKA